MPISPQLPGTPIEWAFMAVPAPLLPGFNREVERFLGLGSATGVSPAVAVPEGRVPSVDEPWTDEALRKFIATRLRAIDIVRSVMDVLAERPEEWFPTSELRPAIDPQVAPGSFKAAWTHLTRHIRAEYGHKKWPLQGKWGPEIPTPLSEVYYQLTKAQADQWRRLRGEGR